MLHLPPVLGFIELADWGNLLPITHFRVSSLRRLLAPSLRLGPQEADAQMEILTWSFIRTCLQDELP